MKILLVLLLSVFVYAKDPTSEVFNKMNFAKNFMPENDYITKEEFSTLEKNIHNIKKEIGTGPYSFLLYFTSSSVPPKTMFNVLHSISILQDNGYKIHSKQYIMGPPADFQGYMMGMYNSINDMDIKVQSKIKRNFGLKIDPRYFDYFKLKKAPAMAIATCPSLVPDIKNCKFHYIIKGDVSLVTFFDKISETNKEYDKLNKILIANKIAGE